jgi:hypothetical protein
VRLLKQKKRSYDQHTVNAVGLTNVTREESFLEHVETGHAEAFRPTEWLARSLVAVSPVVAGPGIEEHRDQEKVDQALGLLFAVRGWLRGVPVSE